MKFGPASLVLRKKALPDSIKRRMIFFFKKQKNTSDTMCILGASMDQSMTEFAFEKQLGITV
jgi:hypothetical protein